MFRIFSLFIVTLLIISPLHAENHGQRSHYELQVDGMVCAFCAYNVTKQFKSHPAIEPDSVTVDLKAKQVTFYASTTIEEQVIKDVLANSGFTVVKIRHRTSREQKTALTTRKLLASVLLPLSELDSTLTLQVIENMAQAALREPGLLIVKGPSNIESDILRSLMGGKKRAIAVDYRVEPGSNVTIILKAL